MKRILSCLFMAMVAAAMVAAPKQKMIDISVQPNEASIFINNQFIGYGSGSFVRPKKGNMAVIRVECNGYKTINAKFYGDDKRSAISYSLQQDGYYRMSAYSGIVNKFFTIDIDSLYYTVSVDNKVDVKEAWKLLHQILLNYFDEIATTDIHGGYLQTPWAYKTFQMSEMQMRNRVTIRDISTPERVAFQIKISSEVAAAAAAMHGEFEEVDRIAKEYEPLIEELQTRIGKVRSL